MNKSNQVKEQPQSYTSDSPPRVADGATIDELPNLETFMREHAEREATYAEIFERIAPEAQYAQEAFSRKIAKDREARLRRWSEREQPVVSQLDPVAERLLAYRMERVQQLHRERAPETPPPRAHSRAAMAMTLQPVRDIVADRTLLVPGDQLLDIIGPRYSNFWTSKSGNAFPFFQTVWADPGDGSFGFDHTVEGTVTGRQANSGAGIYVQFVPRIAPGMAQIRPYLPYSFQWASLSFKSREDNLATFGVRVWSWSDTGDDFATELDYRYYVWNSTIIADHFAEASSPNWEDNQEDAMPGWDYDTAFLFGNEAPYFRTRPNRVYLAAIWCFGVSASVSPQNRPGISIARLHAKVPWVVIGYQ
jgi:hypothetical protein